MLKVNFTQIAGNTATIRTASQVEAQHANELANAVITALQGVKLLNEDESQLLKFVAEINPQLDCKFGGCGDAEKASQQYTHRAVIGEKIVYSINTAPKSLDDLLMNLASTRTLYRAVKIETAKADKAAKTLTFAAFVAAKKLPDAVLSIAGVREGLVTDWFNTLRAMQVSEGAIRNLCKESEIKYTQPK